MHGLRHPFTGDLYEEDGDGGEGRVVRITTADGRVGRYRPDGSWISGDRFDADPQLCVWIGGPRAAHRLVVPTRDKEQP
jgi:hypothetical protein